MSGSDSLTGVPFLLEALAVVRTEHHLPLRYLRTTRAVLDALGIGLEPGLKAIFGNTGDPEAFERWVIERMGGTVDPARVGFANDIVAGGSPSGERAKAIAAIEATPPVLGPDDLARWHEDGFLVLHGAADPAACADLAAEIYSTLGADPGDPATWHRVQLPQGIMVPLHQAAAIDAIHASPRIRRAFADLLGSADLVMTADRCGFNPPLRPGEAWKGPRLHLDLDTYDTPVPLAVQGILYLTDTAPEQGALRVVRGFQQRIDAWLEGLPAGCDPSLEDLEAFGPEPIGAPGNSLVLWHQALPHGPGPNTTATPRLVHYIQMYPPPPPFGG